MAAIARAESSLVTSNVEVLTVEKAKEFLRRNHLRQRRVRGTNVRFLCGAIRRGEYVLNGDAIRFDVEGYMIDGQHHCLAVVETGIPIPILVVRGLSEDARRTIDQGLPRKACDILGTSPHDTAIARTIHVLMSNRFNFEKRSPAQLSEVMSTYGEDTAAVNESLGHRIEPGIHVQAALAAPFVLLWRAAPGTVRCVAERVHTGANCERGRPESLIRAAAAAGSTRGAVTRFDLSRRVARAILAAIDGEELHVLRPVSNEMWSKIRERIATYG